jgi:hypothetical protein
MVAPPPRPPPGGWQGWQGSHGGGQPPMQMQSNQGWSNQGVNQGWGAPPPPPPAYSGRPRYA